jgi:hypothetical protein
MFGYLDETGYPESALIEKRHIFDLLILRSPPLLQKRNRSIAIFSFSNILISFLDFHHRLSGADETSGLCGLPGPVLTHWIEFLTLPHFFH